MQYSHREYEDNFQPKNISLRDLLSPWVYDTRHGYINDLGGFSYPLLTMKRAALSKSLRIFFYHMQRIYQVKYIHFDCDADIIDDETVFDW
ncbi:DUF5983 family protein [Entomohabitans teleogrylli]|uniref:DUF5983 family protein n=1 Tax=Entomohabitans teleogrylli TaxID=1384589 RepID=UPI00073D66F0